MRNAFLWGVSLLVLSGCLSVGGHLSPSVSGCYRVHADEWSDRHAQTTGFRALPEIVALDTARLGRILVPASWRVNDPPNTNRATLDLDIAPWHWTGDTLWVDPEGIRHPMQQDSVIITFIGWGGKMTTYLERREQSFAGIGFFTPQIDPGQIRGIPVLLRPSSCVSDLMEGWFEHQE